MKRSRAAHKVTKANDPLKNALTLDNIPNLEIAEEVPIKKLFIDDSTRRVTRSSIRVTKKDLSRNDSDDSLMNSLLNDDCLIKIFSNLGIVDKIRIERVCKLWQALSKQSWTSMKRFDYTSTTWGEELSYQEKLNIATLRNIFIRCGRYITIVNLGFFLSVTVPTIMKIVGKFCPNLEEIYAPEYKLTSSAITSLTKNCKKIKILVIGCVPHKKCDDDLGQLFIANEKLECLYIQNNDRITGECFEYLSADVIKDIALRNCTSLRAASLNKALQKFNNLTHLQLKSCVDFNQGTLKVIGEKISLNYLEISRYYPKISESTMHPLANLVNIKELRLLENDAVTDKFLIHISNKCQHLELLLIDSCTKVTNIGISSLAKLTKLKVLSINELFHVTDEAIDNLYMLRTLLCAQCIDITDEAIARFVEMATGLRTLDVSGRLLTESLYQKLSKIMKRRTHRDVLRIFIDDSDYDFEDSSPDNLHEESPSLLFEYVNY